MKTVSSSQIITIFSFNRKKYILFNFFKGHNICQHCHCPSKWKASIWISRAISWTSRTARAVLWLVSLIFYLFVLGPIQVFNKKKLKSGLKITYFRGPICPDEVCESCAEEGATDIKTILKIDCQEGLEDCHKDAEDCTADVADCLEPLKDCNCIDPSAGLFNFYHQFHGKF